MTLTTLWFMLYMGVGIGLAETGLRNRTVHRGEKKIYVAVTYLVFVITWPLMSAILVRMACKRRK